MLYLEFCWKLSIKRECALWSGMFRVDSRSHVLVAWQWEKEMFEQWNPVGHVSWLGCLVKIEVSCLLERKCALSENLAFRLKNIQLYTLRHTISFGRILTPHAQACDWVLCAASFSFFCLLDFCSFLNFFILFFLWHNNRGGACTDKQLHGLGIIINLIIIIIINERLYNEALVLSNSTLLY